MGYRFRKSFKAGPFRTTISKSGISTSVGIKGARITKKANGKTITTLSVPKTGLSYTTEKNTNKKSISYSSQEFTVEDSKKIIAYFCRIIGIPMIIISTLVSLVEPIFGCFGILIGLIEFNYSRKYFKKIKNNKGRE